MLENIYSQTVTILNKLKRTDSLTNSDVWYKTILNDVAWYTEVERSASANAVYIGTYITVLIPFHSIYLPYTDWKENSMQIGHYTMSTGDYIVKGVVEDDITAGNIVKTLEKYGDDVCLVKHCTLNHDRFGAHVQLKIQGV